VPGENIKKKESFLLLNLFNLLSITCSLLSKLFFSFFYVIFYAIPCTKHYTQGTAVFLLSITCSLLSKLLLSDGLTIVEQ